MESTYLCKVDERVLKLMVSVGANMEVIELETPADFAKFNTIVEAMKTQSPYTLAKLLVDSKKKYGTSCDLSDIFVYNNQRYYSTTEVIDMLTDIKSIKSNKPLQGLTMVKRIETLMEKIIWQ